MAQWLRDIEKLDWPRNSLKFAPFFVAYGALAGLIAGTIESPTRLAISVLLGIAGAFATGYLTPRSVDIFGRGPVMAQIGTGVFGALAGAILARFIGA